MRNILNKFGVSSDRSLHNAWQIVLSAFFKFGSILVLFLLIPLSIEVLGEEHYGFWIAVSAFLSWFAFVDLGVISVLRNKFAEALAENDSFKAKKLVSNAYFINASIGLYLFGVFALLSSAVPWAKWFNITSVSHDELSLFAILIFAAYVIQWNLETIVTLCISVQKPMVGHLYQFCSHALSLGLIFGLSSIHTLSLIEYGLILLLSPISVLLILSLIYFSKEFRAYLPSLKLIEASTIRSLVRIGIVFFIGQLAWISITTVDNLLIASFFNPEEVVPYSVSMRLFSVPLMLHLLIVTPFWSAITEAQASDDTSWIQRSMRGLQFIALAFVAFCILLVFITPVIYSIWLGEQFAYDFYMDLSIALFTSLVILNTTYSYYLYGRSKILLQMIVTVFAALVNLPLSYYLSVQLNFGPKGIVMSTVVSMLPVLCVTYIQFRKVLEQKAKGLWNR